MTLVRRRPRSRRRGLLRQVAVAHDDGQPRILRVAGIRCRERTPQIDRAAPGRSQHCMAATATQPSALPNMQKPIRHLLIIHDRTVMETRGELSLDSRADAG